MTTSYSQSANPDATNSELDAKKIVKNVQLNKELIDEISEVFEDLEKENESLEVLIKEVNSND